MTFLFRSAFLAFLLSCISCVKDVDLDQAQDIVLSPVVELDLVYFDLAPSDFVDPESGLAISTLRDTTEIRFLDDPDIGESLRQIDFFFRFNNSVERPFQVGFSFLSEANDTTYATQTIVAPGLPDSAVITEFEEIVVEPEIFELTRANRVVVAVTFPDARPHARRKP